MSEGGPGQANVHAAWRMAVAERAAAAYAPNRRLAVFAVAGSVGTGWADRFSDLEVDCYWHEPPEDRDRLAPIEALGGQIVGSGITTRTRRSGARITRSARWA